MTRKSFISLASLVILFVFAFTAFVPALAQNEDPRKPVGPYHYGNEDAVKKKLQHINLPDGFDINLFALVPGARFMTVGPNVGVVFVGTRGDKMYTVVDRDDDGVADEVAIFAPHVNFKFPNDSDFNEQGHLFVCGHNTIWQFPAAEFFYKGAQVAKLKVVDGWFPKDKEYFNHAFRVCEVGPDGKLYVAIGQPWNVPPKDKHPGYYDYKWGTISRLNTDGSNFEIFAKGVRNSMGLFFHPETGELFWNDNQVDGMGPDKPAGEFNHSPSAGGHYGFPWYGGGKTRTNQYMDSSPPDDVIFPVIEWQAHSANLGGNFYTGDMFPSEYNNDLLHAQHGSWNRKIPVGAQVKHTSFNDEGMPTSHEPFMTGCITEKNKYRCRPVDVAVQADGSILVSDDLTGAIYRITYEGM